ncbi:MAG: hypothetical protein Q9170_007761 [Blastenia crenularia]
MSLPRQLVDCEEPPNQRDPWDFTPQELEDYLAYWRPILRKQFEDHKDDPPYVPPPDCTPTPERALPSPPDSDAGDHLPRPQLFVPILGTERRLDLPRSRKRRRITRSSAKPSTRFMELADTPKAKAQASTFTYLQSPPTADTGRSDPEPTPKHLQPSPYKIQKRSRNQVKQDGGHRKFLDPGIDALFKEAARAAAGRFCHEEEGGEWMGFPGGWKESAGGVAEGAVAGGADADGAVTEGGLADRAIPQGGAAEASPAERSPAEGAVTERGAAEGSPAP